MSARRPARRSVSDASLVNVKVDVVIPVLNEERALPGCVAVLHDYLTAWLPCDWVITIVDNASTDGTRMVAKRLERTRSRVRVMALEERGKGKAIRAAWTNSDADVVAYMDVDLSTGLDAFVPLVTSLAAGHSDVAIGSRLVPGARTVRGPKREFVSRVYNALLTVVHRVTFRDAQCGFKAVRADVVRPLLDKIVDDTWFFDTEMLLLAEHNGLRVLELPVDWVEDVDTRVRVGSVATTNLRGLYRVAVARFSGAADIADLPVRPAPRPVHPDAVVSERDGSRARPTIPLLGIAATLVLYAAFRTWWPPVPANLAALAASTLFTAGARRPFRPGFRAVARGLLYAAFTSGALLALSAIAATPPRWAELVVLLAAAILGTAGRFALSPAPGARTPEAVPASTHQDEPPAIAS